MNSFPPVRIRLFGPPSLEREDGSAVTGRPTQRHRVALLALLSLAPSHRMSRDKAMAWLWPDADAERARNLLKVSSYVLRSELGDGILISSGEEIRLGDAVRVDVAEFEDAVRRGDHERAAALYTGPFLDGFFLPEAEEFEAWTERERQRLAVIYGKSLAAFAEAAEAAGDRDAAVDRWRARAALDPYDSQIALRLMRALEASGNRAGAIQHANEHARLLRKELGVEAAEVVRVAEGMRGGESDRSDRADRSDGSDGSGTEKRTVTAASRAISSDLSDLSDPSDPSDPTRRRRYAAAFALLVPLALIAWLAFSRGAAPERSIVVLPFANLVGTGERDYFSDGLTDEIITGLATVPGLTVIARTSAMRYASSVTPIPEIARELGVANVLHGTLRREGNRARVTAQLVDARRERVLWANSYDSEIGDTLGVQERIARDVVRALELELGGRPIVRPGTRNAEAFDAYQRARFHWTRRTPEDVAQSIRYFERAIALDSSFADAYAGLSDAWYAQSQLGYTDAPFAEVLPRVLWASERAISLDDASADAHASLASVLKWQGNWPGSEREYRRAISLNPNHASAHHWYALLLTGLGRQDEAVRIAHRSVELDPYAPIIVISYGWQCYIAHDWDCALEQFERALELDPELLNAEMQKARVYAHLGRREEAMASARRALAQYSSPTMLAELAFVHAMVGDREAARKVLDRARVAPYVSMFHVARAWSALGEPDSAFAALDRHDTWMWSHRATIYDPGLDPLRDDPRMEALRVRIEREMGVR